MRRRRKKNRGDSNILATLWYYSCEDATDVYDAMIHSVILKSPDYQWYGTRRSIYGFRVWGCHIEAVHGIHLKNLVDRTKTGYFLGTTAISSVIRYWNQSKLKIIGFCTIAKLNEYENMDPNEELSTGSKITQDFPQDQDIKITKI